MVHESQCEVAFLTKKVEISNNHQRLVLEALEKAKLELVALEDSNKFYEHQIKHNLEKGVRPRLRLNWWVK